MFGADCVVDRISRLPSASQFSFFGVAMERFDDLDRLLDHLWSYATAAVDNRDNAMTTPALATTGPAVRTVALRRTDRDDRVLACHTDIRSAKVEQLDEQPRAVWMAWDPDISQQFQFAGTTSIHTDDEIADAMWRTEPAENLGFYYKPDAPGDRLDEPGSSIDTDAVCEDRARQHFGVVRTIVDQITWVHLHPDVEYRARFTFDDGEFRGRWIVP